MGLIGIIKQVARVVRSRTGYPVTDLEVDTGGNELTTAESFGTPNIDTVPRVGDLVFTAERSGAGRRVDVGTVDPNMQQDAGPGEIRIYSRNGDGTQVAQVWLKGSGEIVLENDNGSFTLNPDGSQRGQNGAGFYTLGTDGDFEANGAKMTTDGDVVTSDGVSLRNHTHEQPPDSDGDTEQPTLPPTPGA